MHDAIGRRRWAVPDGYIPGWSHGPAPEMKSHEALCILNASADEARVEITVFFADRDPIGPYVVLIPARRTRHVRLNDLRVPAQIPLQTEFSTILESNVPIVVQHTRLDSRQAANALLSTIAFPLDV
jgi:hypothetical protein